MSGITTISYDSIQRVLEMRFCSWPSAPVFKEEPLLPGVPHEAGCRSRLLLRSGFCTWTPSPEPPCFPQLVPTEFPGSLPTFFLLPSPPQG